MARVTVEDCILNIPNRFELVMIASQRAKQIASGNPLTVDRDNDKDAVVALREIADKTVDLNGLNEEVINGFSKRQLIEMDKPAADETGISPEVEEEFEDMKQNMAMLTKGKVGSGLSFVDENIQVED